MSFQINRSASPTENPLNNSAKLSAEIVRRLPSMTDLYSVRYARLGLDGAETTWEIFLFTPL